MKARKRTPSSGPLNPPSSPARTVSPSSHSGGPPEPLRRPAGSPPMTADELQRIIAAGHAAAQCDDPLAAPAQRAIELLARLVATPSVSRHEANAARLLAGWLEDAGLESCIDEVGNAVGSFQTPGRTDRPVHIMLLGHIDTVPGDIPMRIEHRTLHGRGAVDAKGSLAAFAAAAARLAGQSSTLPPGFRLTIVGAVEEEIATSRGARHIAEQFKDEPPSACFIGEPSGVDGVTLGYKGRLIARARFQKDCAHSAGPETTAAEMATEFWQACKAIAGRHDSRLIEKNGPFYRLQTVLRSICSSDDGLHQAAECVVGFRLPCGGPSAQDLEARIRTLASDLPFNAPGVALTLEFEGHERPHQSPRDDAAARHLCTAIRKSIGRTPRLKLKTGTSDMNVVAPVFNCPIVAYGPGDSSLDHTPHEHVHLDLEYLPAIDVLVEAIRGLAWELARTNTQPAESVAAK